MKRKRLVLFSVLVLVAALIAWGTWAYFTTSIEATNQITTGTIQIKLNDTMTGAEVTTDEKGNPTATLPTSVMPGQPVDKTVSVTNTGTGQAWIRVKVDTAIADAYGKPLPTTINDGVGQESAVQIAYDADNQNWVRGDDGYDYYAVPVEANQSTDNLFSGVMLNKFVGNDYENCKVVITVSAQAVQVKNNPIPVDGAVMDITGWPTEAK